MKRRILVFFGTRPEALKLAPVVQAIKDQGHFEVRSILTAQHRQMIDQVIRLFGIRVDMDLDLMTANQTLASLSQRLMGRLGHVFEKYHPDLVMVEGDTTTAFIVALYSFYHKIPVAHVEAGLRTGNKYHPFPEEVNRRLITHLSDYHLAPTRAAKANLLREGVDGKRIAVTGNTVIDSLFWVRDHLKKTYPRFKSIDFSKRTILLTAHRRENIGRPLVEITRAVRSLLTQFHDLQIIYPVHLNPGVQKIVRDNLEGVRRAYLFPPLPYDETVYLMNQSTLILTDSGGIQEEAPSLGKPVLVLRQVSERMEGARAGALKIVGTEARRIVRETSRLLNSPRAYSQMARVRHVYGDGLAARRIVEHLKRWRV